MAQNRGKQFEQHIQEAFEKVEGVSVDRLHDQTTGYLGSSNICDFIVYRKPYEYYFECKSVHGNTLSIHSIPKPDKKGVLHGFYGNITDTQWEGLLEKSKISGVIAGVICWWVDKDTTMFIDIRLLEELRKRNYKSINYCASFALEDIEELPDMWTWVMGKKKRVFFDYDMEVLLNEISDTRN
jgi:hypothetical protein